MSIEGLTHLPAFLIHDSPREADLGLGVYHRLFHFVRDLEDDGDRPSFQVHRDDHHKPAEHTADGSVVGGDARRCRG